MNMTIKEKVHFCGFCNKPLYKEIYADEYKEPNVTFQKIKHIEFYDGKLLGTFNKKEICHSCYSNRRHILK